MDYKQYVEKVHKVLHVDNYDVDFDRLGEIYKIDGELYEDVLEACPFCGSEAQIYRAGSGVCSAVTLAATDEVKCTVLDFHDIRCSNPTCFLSRGAGWQITNKTELTRKWNHRKTLM